MDEVINTKLAEEFIDLMKGKIPSMASRSIAYRQMTRIFPEGMFKGFSYPHMGKGECYTLQELSGKRGETGNISVADSTGDDATEAEVEIEDTDTEVEEEGQDQEVIILKIPSFSPYHWLIRILYLQTEHSLWTQETIPTLIPGTLEEDSTEETMRNLQLPKKKTIAEWKEEAALADTVNDSAGESLEADKEAASSGSATSNEIGARSPAPGCSKDVGMEDSQPGTSKSADSIEPASESILTVSTASEPSSEPVPSTSRGPLIPTGSESSQFDPFEESSSFLDSSFKVVKGKPSIFREYFAVISLWL